MVRHLSLVFAFVALSSAAYGQTPDGTWKWTTTMGEYTIDSTLQLESDGEQVTGVYKDQNIEQEIENVSLNGDELSFEITTKMNDNDLNVQWRGTVLESSIDGMAYIFVNGQQQGEGIDWMPKLHVSMDDVVGTWNFDFTAPDGRHYEPVVVFEAKDGKLTGTRRADNSELESVELDESVLVINDSVSLDGSPIELQYKLHPRGNKMTGKLEYTGGDGQSGEIDVKATRQKQLPAELKKLLGKWEFTMVGDDGVERHPVVILSDNNGQLKAAMSDEGRVFELRDLAYEDGEISFSTTNQHDGVDVDINWTMKPSDNGMVGTLEYDAGGATGEIDFTGKRKE